jgi:hypothetical protein
VSIHRRWRRQLPSAACCTALCAVPPCLATRFRTPLMLHIAGVTPAALLRLSALGGAATPPLAAAIRQQHGGGSTPEHGRAGGGSPLAAPEGESSRVLASPELLPVPYTQRLELVVDAPCGAGEASDKGAATVVAPTTGAVTSVGDPATGDGMENLSQRAASLRFGRDLRLLEVRRLLRSSAPVTMRLSNVPEPSDAGESGRGSRACELFVSLGPGLSGLLACCGESALLPACLLACMPAYSPRQRACASHSHQP